MQRLILLVLGSGMLLLGVKNLSKSEKALLPVEASTLPNAPAISSGSSTPFKPTEIKRAPAPMELDSKAIVPELTLVEIERAIDQVESELVNSNALERLNQNVASEDERSRYEELFKNRDRLNKQKLSLKRAALNQKISDLEKNRASRLESYGIKHEEKFSE